ncbi:MAG: chromosome segregation protein SMC [Ndongobacter sp.]|nr:chromosome segregation protein SMC [Ndongobacter sp.]
MKLKYLELYGFKSFAEKKRLEFRHDFVGVVGPNGSGKSNISDAIRWVLGEQSVKALRGAKMEDVIFSGTQKKAPMNMAQVTIAFDNADGTIALPYEEVAVTRKVYRSGESEYLINQAPVRRKDIRELFLDTGIGKEGYSIIGQGRIEDILSSRSEDRREIFEEAAGISKLKFQKAESQKRLEKTEATLEKVSVELNAKIQQEAILKKQADNAKRGYQLTQELEQNELSLLKKQLHSIDDRALEAKAEQQRIQEELEEVVSQLEALNTELAPVQERLQGFSVQQEEMERQRRGEEHTIAEAKRISAVREEQLRFYDQDLIRLQRDIETRQEHLEQLAEETERVESRIGELDRQQADLRGQLSGLSEQNSDAEQRLQEEIDAAEKERSEIEERLHYLEFEEKAQTQRAEDLQEQRRQWDEDRAALRAKRAELQEGQGAMQDEVAQRAKALTRLDADRTAIQHRLRENEEWTRRSAEQRAALSNELSAMKSRYQVLQTLVENYEGYFKPVQQFLKVADREPELRAHFIGVLADLIQVKSPYETAIDVCLGAGLQNIVVETEQDAKFLIEVLKKRRLGRITFLPLDRIRGPKPVPNAAKEALCNAVDAVIAEPRFAPILNHFLARTTLVRSIDDAIRLSHRRDNTDRIVSLEGDVVNTSGSMVGGSMSHRQGGSLLNRKKQLEELKRALPQKQEALDALAQEEQLRNAEREELLKRGDELASAYPKCLDELQQAREQEASRGVEVQLLDEKIEELSRRLDEKTGHAEIDFAAQKKEWGVRHRSVLDRLRGFSQSLKKEQEIRAARGKEVVALQGRSDFNERELLLAKNRLADCAMRREEWLRQNDEAQQQIQALEIKKDAGKREISSLACALEQSTRRLEELAQGEDALLKKRHSVEETVARQSLQREELSAVRIELDKQDYQLGVRIESLAEQRAQCVENYREQYDLSVENVWERLKVLVPVETTKQRVASIKQELSRIGFFNFDSIEEYEQIAQEVAFLRFQTEDLNKSKADIMTLIEDLDRTMSSMFRDSFRRINEKYDEIFRILFQGGHGELVLDSGDVLSAGIEIAAQPPGKKLQSLGLLSGGERSLTAMALLFAIFSIRPTPFCILDEIDASLDEANIGRYVRFLQTLTDSTQFIVITHRKTTMELAEMLYGVTMEEGISRVLTLSLEEYEE